MADAAFGMLVTISSSYSFAVGKRDARLCSAMFALAWLVSIPARNLPYATLGYKVYVATVDGVMLWLLASIVAATRSFWPIWVLGFHLANTAVDLAILIDGKKFIIKYSILHSFWALPELIVMPLGIALDQRRSAGSARE